MPAIEFPAGVTTLLSKTAKTANWREANLMRWDDGVTLRPISGWEQIVYPTAFASRVRAIHRWMTKAGIFYLAYLCESHCYIDTGGSLFDCTPTGGMATAPPLVAGYGELDYGEETYGTPRTGISTLTKFSPAWSINNWGENLVFMSSYDGRLLQWVATTPTVKAVVVTGAPTNNRQFVVTPQRHLMLFGMGGQQADFGWCSEENINDWNFASTTNTAGKYTADPFAPIVAAHSSSVGISVHTPAMTHFVDYIGLPYVYRTRPIGRVPIPISAASMSSIPEGIVWISIEGFWMYNGSTADTIPCPVWDVIAENMDFERTVRESHSVNLLARGEIWWFWVPKGSLEPTRYAALDYRGKIWMSGYLHRTSGNTYANDRYPIMSDGFKVWKHETGFQYPGAPYLPFLESQVINLEGGDAWNTISKIMPDVAGDKTALAFRLAMSNNRSNYATGEKLSPQRTINEHGWVDIRETARDVRLRIEMIKNNDWSTIGPIIFDIKQRGRR